jgi:hypothetical protein
VITVLLHIIIILLVLGIVWWLVGYLPLPAPFGQIIRVIIIIIAIIVIISLAWPLTISLK